VCHKSLRVQSVALAESPHANRILGVKTAENYATGFRAYVRSSDFTGRVSDSGTGLNAETQRNAEKRRDKLLSANLCESLHCYIPFCSQAAKI